MEKKYVLIVLIMSFTISNFSQQPKTPATNPIAANLGNKMSKEAKEKLKKDREYLERQRKIDHAPSAEKDAGLISCHEEYEKKRDEINKVHHEKTLEQRKKDVNSFYDKLRNATGDLYKCYKKYPVDRSYRSKLIENHKENKEKKRIGKVKPKN
jgi:hypothetical protein